MYRLFAYLAVGLMLCLAPGCPSPQASAAVPGVASRVATVKGRTLVTLSNPFLELTFEPARGGRCVRFRFRDNGEQIIAPDAVAGMFLDHWAKYAWPSGLMHLPYEHELLGDGKSRVGIRLWVEVPAQGGGKGSENAAASAAIPTSPDLVGLIVRKTIWLSAGSDAIQVQQEVENPTGESRGVAPYFQHNLVLGGKRFHDNWYLPSTRGVLVNVQPANERGKAIGPDWVPDPTAGWMGVIDRQTGRGLLFAFDYNYLEKTYTCGQTAEWFFETVPVGPGKRFETRYTIKPLVSFRDLVHGSTHLAADIRPDEVGGKVRVAHDLAAVSRPLSNLDVAFTAVAWKSKAVLARRSLKLPRLGFTKVRQEITFAAPRLADGVVVRASVRGDGVDERYEYYYAGDKEERDRRYGYFTTKGGALAGAKGDAYFLKPPRKRKRFDKPEFATLARPEPGRFRCLVAFGLYTDILDLDGATEGWKPEGRSAPEFSWANCPPNAAESFPGSYDELFRYHAVWLSDVNYKAMGDIGFEMLCDYVEQGGSLVVSGGSYALGNGEFEETRFLQVLPVKLSGPFDLKWAGKGRSWPLTPAAPSHPLVQGVSFARDPRVFWRHQVSPKPGAQVILRAGDHPALVVGRYGKGRVAVLALSPTGEAPAGETAWWRWDGWPVLVRNLLAWPAERPGG